MLSFLSLPSSRLLIDAALAGSGQPVQADQAARELRDDLERWSRWALGVLGYLLAVCGAFVLLGMVEAVRLLARPAHPVDVAVLIGAGLSCLAGCSVLGVLWWTGRRLSRATAWWLRLPYTAGGRQRGAGGWLSARTVNFEPRVFARLVTGTIAALVGIAAVALLARDLQTGQTPLTGGAAAVAIISLASSVGQLGGVLRLVAALGEGDPIWSRIRSATNRIVSR